MIQPLPPLAWGPDRIHFKGFSRGLAEMQWLLAVTACYLLLLFHLHGEVAFAVQGSAVVAAHVVMFLLAGYLTTVLADAIHFANEQRQVLAYTDQLTDLYSRTILRSITTHCSPAPSGKAVPSAC